MLSGKLKLLVPVLAIALLATSFLWSYSDRPAFAHITLEVNPNLTLTVDSRNRVLSVELGEGKAQELFANTDFRHMPLEAALRQITAKIEAAGLLTPERRVLLTAHAAQGTTPEQLAPLVKRAHAAVDVHIRESSAAVPVATAIVSAPLSEAAKRLGVLPSVYAELIAGGISNETLVALFGQLTGEGITAKNFRKEIRDIAESLLDMREEGIDEAVALQVLQKAIKADPALREVTTIAYDFLDLVEAGFTPEAAVSAIARAIAADPTLREHGTIVAFLADLMEKGLPEAEALAKLDAAIAADPTLRSLDDLVEKGPPGSRGRALGRDRDKDRADDDDEDDEDDMDDEDDEDMDDDDQDDEGTEGDKNRGQGRGAAGGSTDSDDEDSDDDESNKPAESNKPVVPGSGRGPGR